MELKNIDDLLRECPEGTKLYSPIFGVVSLENVNTDGWIKVIPKRTGILQLFYPDGRFSEDGEVMLFPSDTNRNWDNFVIPFKDGDILTTELGSVFILKTDINSDKRYGYYVGVDWGINSLWLNNFFVSKSLCRYANEEEKQKLFDAIKANGYKWNEETKNLEKLAEPKFKAGDKIEKCGYRFTVKEVKSDYYLTKCGNKIPINNQDDFSLVPNKFDINTLVPFESRVLVRDDGYSLWNPSLWGLYDKEHRFPYVTVGSRYKQCIPYIGNEHLLGKTDDCDDYYKTWE